MKEKGFILIEHEHSKNVSRDKGFILIELSVVIAIIAVLTFTFSVNYRGGEKEFALKRSAHLVARGIAKAQEMSISAKEFSCPGETTVPSGGYGAMFYNSLNYGNRMFLFADCNNDQQTTWEGAGVGESMEEIFFEEGVKIKYIYLEGTPTYATFISFIPPDPTVCFAADCENYNYIRIVLTLESDEEKTQTIRVNRAGLIEIE